MSCNQRVLTFGNFHKKTCFAKKQKCGLTLPKSADEKEVVFDVGLSVTQRNVA